MSNSMPAQLGVQPMFGIGNDWAAQGQWCSALLEGKPGPDMGVREAGDLAVTHVARAPNSAKPE